MITDAELDQISKELKENIRFPVFGTEGVMDSDRHKDNEVHNTVSIMNDGVPLEEEQFVEFELLVKHEDEENETLVYYSEEDLRQAVGELLTDGYRLDELELTTKFGVKAYYESKPAPLHKFL